MNKDTFLKYLGQQKVLDAREVPYNCSSINKGEDFFLIDLVSGLRPHTFFKCNNGNVVLVTYKNKGHLEKTLAIAVIPRSKIDNNSVLDVTEFVVARSQEALKTVENYF